MKLVNNLMVIGNNMYVIRQVNLKHILGERHFKPSFIYLDMFDCSLRS